MTSSYVMSSLQSCASILNPCEFTYMITASMLSFCCCYDVFARIRWIMRLCLDCDELYIWFTFYILFLSNSCMFSISFYCFGQVVDSNSERERLCMIVGPCPPMSSLSDRNMRLGDVLLTPGRKQWCL